MKHISSARFNLIIDAIYNNCQRPSVDRKSISQIATDCETSVTTVSAVRQLLVDSKLLIIEGEKRSQTTTWHPGKAAPNTKMLTNLYEAYTKFEAKTAPKKSGKISLEAALKTLVNLGYIGVISKSKKSGYTTIVESIDLSKVEM